MGIDYRLTLAGDLPVEQVAQRALPDPAERPAGTARLLSVNLDAAHGFAVGVRAGRDGYVDVTADHGQWLWKPKQYVSLTFHMDKQADPVWAVGGMLTIVHRVLHTGPEDATLVLNGDWLLLHRAGGTLVRHRASWWDNYGVGDMFTG
ncbi:SitI3 family protein [Catellatospora citrea]|uniref:SitI3 family protein n=1 Tax=Catellatospora citrea TaxID=53366 RepID=UPI0033E81FCC